MKHGAIRNWLETIKFIAKLSDLTLEQVADVFDANALLTGVQPKSSSDDPLMPQGPRRPQ